MGLDVVLVRLGMINVVVLWTSHLLFDDCFWTRSILRSRTLAASPAGGITNGTVVCFLGEWWGPLVFNPLVSLFLEGFRIAIRRPGGIALDRFRIFQY